MPETGSIPTEHIEIFVGFFNGFYRAVDGNGEPANQVECLGGSRGTQMGSTAVSWTIHNRCGHDIEFRLNNFQSDSQGKCPVVGGDISGCQTQSLVVAKDGSRLVQTALNFQAQTRRYQYDLVVVNAETQVGNIVDPELQIDM